jgi:glycosyltransferase involved in cell wall biosynthesis
MRALLRRITGVQPPRHALSDRPSDNLLRNLTIALSSRADVVVSPSEHQAADLAATGLERLAVVPNPIARSHRPAVLLTAEQAARPRILWVARCEPEKRPVVFATAVLDALERTGGAFEVDFVGDGSELAEVRLLTADAPQFRVLGSLTHEAVLDLIDGSSIVALTSYGFDNQPMTIAESVSRYRGVLFCDPRLREGLGDSGALSATPDATALADTIVDLVTHPERLLALSEGAERDSTTFSAATYVERVLAVYLDSASIAAAAQTC